MPSPQTDVFDVPRDVIADREGHIVKRCAGMTVLHLGCCDHPFTEEAIRTGRWLHGRLADAASELVGLDLSTEGYATCQRLGRAEGIVIGDACTVEDLPRAPFDRIVAGEILEHVPNPGAMLSNMARFLNPDGILIVTVPNAFCLRKQLRVMLGRESVHRDHVFYFSHRTLARLVNASGFRVERQANYLLHDDVPLLSKVLERIALRLSPAALEGLYLEARVRAGQ